MLGLILQRLATYYVIARCRLEQAAIDQGACWLKEQAPQAAEQQDSKAVFKHKDAACQ
jgi:hypothetical protein